MRNKRMETCCCTGHRDIPHSLEAPLKTAFKEQVGLLLAQGVIYYGVGGAVGFDTLAAEVLFELRVEHPQIKVILVYPFNGFDSRWQEGQRTRYRALLPKYDKRVCVSRTPGREAYLMRDRHLVDCSAHCVAFCSRSYGGTAYTMRYAKKNGRQVYNLAERIACQI